MDAEFRSLSKQAADCQRSIQRLGTVDSIKAHEDLSQTIRNNIRALANAIESIRLSANEQDTQSTQREMIQRLEEYQKQHDQLQISSRQAIFKSQQRIRADERESRAKLFGMAKDGKSFTEQFELLQRHKSGNAEALLNATNNVTEALQRTSTLMQQELEKSAYSISALADSSKTLSATVGEYQNLGSLLGMSRRLITQLEASDWLDRIVLGLGLLMFCLVVLYIIKKRTYDVGKSWLFWMSNGLPSMPSPTLASSAVNTKTMSTLAQVTTPASLSTSLPTLLSTPTNIVDTSTLEQISTSLVHTWREDL
ncbi:Sec20-domain-containing protein [Hesseltinella vesiculosa]|uniref:Sec20-domain-containing protein n=1 Tax=Hesseltinella vesiculosa TaxID=101127 RepID=A0A1X2GIW1_9FUNG|nr:Sec20-domain-containing protein [Hesseltinella vesiculosa]